MRNRDYTKKSDDSTSGTLVLRAVAERTAKKRLTCVEDRELFSLLVEMLVREYYVNHELYKKHIEETNDLY